MSRVTIPSDLPFSLHTAGAATPISRIRWLACRRVSQVAMQATSAFAVSSVLVTQPPLFLPETKGPRRFLGRRPSSAWLCQARRAAQGQRSF